MFDEAMIRRTKRGACIVNTARAEICNRDAIVQALESGHLAGYAGDVWSPSARAIRASLAYDAE